MNKEDYLKIFEYQPIEQTLKEKNHYQAIGEKAFKEYWKQTFNEVFKKTVLQGPQFIAYSVHYSEKHNYIHIIKACEGWIDEYSKDLTIEDVLKIKDNILQKTDAPKYEIEEVDIINEVIEVWTILNSKKTLSNELSVKESIKKNKI